MVFSIFITNLCLFQSGNSFAAASQGIITFANTEGATNYAVKFLSNQAQGTIVATSDATLTGKK